MANDRDAFLRHRRAVADSLAELGASVLVVAGGDPAPPTGSPKWRYIHNPMDRLSISLVDNFSFYRRLAAIMEREAPDVVHLITLKPAVFGGIAAVRMARRDGKPRRILMTIPGLGRLMAPGSRGAGRLSGPIRWAVGRTISWLSTQPRVHFVFETPHDRDFWIGGGLVRRDNSSVVNGAGVDPSRFYPPSAREPRAKLRFLFASRLLRSKGLAEFVEAARQFAGRAEFVVAGWNDPADLDDYSVEQLRREPSIVFLGSVADMPGLLRSADVVCLPTRYGEGIPRILIEAAATGLASIASDQAGTRLIVRDAETGLLLKAPEPAGIGPELCLAIGMYVDNPDLARRHGQAAFDHFVAGGFSEKVIVGRFMEMLGVRNEL